jgi:hypothetical protein
VAPCRTRAPLCSSSWVRACSTWWETSCSRCASAGGWIDPTSLFVLPLCGHILLRGPHALFALCDSAAPLRLFLFFRTLFCTSFCSAICQGSEEQEHLIRFCSLAPCPITFSLRPLQGCTRSCLGHSGCPVCGRIRVSIQARRQAAPAGPLPTKPLFAERPAVLIPPGHQQWNAHNFWEYWGRGGHRGSWQGHAEEGAPGGAPISVAVGGLALPRRDAGVHVGGGHARPPQPVRDGEDFCGPC